MRHLIILAILMRIPSITAMSATYLVCPDGSGDFVTIQAAIDQAMPGDVLELCDATFTGPGNHDIDFLGKAITIRSESGNALACIIDADRAGRGFVFANNEGAGSVIENLIIRDGETDEYGGGIQCIYASPYIRGCILDGCQAGSGGGGIYSAGGSPTIEQCIINDAYSSEGGGLYITNGSAAIDKCIISNCEASAAVYLFESNVSITNSTLADNVGGFGAIYCQQNSDVVVRNSIIAFTEIGEAIALSSGCWATLTCCDLYGNDGGDWTGAIAAQLGINGNIQLDPGFCREHNSEEPYALVWYSPCGPSFNPACSLIGAGTVGCDVPHIGILDGHLYQDGFGQNNGFAFEPADPGNANIALDLSGGSATFNSWLGDSAVVYGPEVLGDEDRWLAELCLRVALKGPEQDAIVGYGLWKNRLASDPEIGFVSVLMDSVERFGLAVPDSFATYFHEEDPGFDPGYPDFVNEQEILPDGLFAPGTQIEYYYRGFYYAGSAPPADYYVLDTEEFEILPRMRREGGPGSAIVWPEVLYIDAYDDPWPGGEVEVEEQIGNLFDRLNIPYDRYDYLGASTTWNAPLRRSYAGGGYNPGGHGNNGCTVGQLLGYRLILLNTGSSGPGTLEGEDIVLLQEWLNFKDCSLLDTRRGLILNGDQIGTILDSLDQLGIGDVFAQSGREELQAPMQQVLGFALLQRDATPTWGEPEHCVFVETEEEADRSSVFEPLDPGIALYGAGNTPDHNQFAQLGVDSTVVGAVGNLIYHYSFASGHEDTLIRYAQIARDAAIPDSSNWRSIVDGFSLHHLSEWNCPEVEECEDDSTCVARGIDNLMRPELDWIMGGAADTLLGLWSFTCSAAAIDEHANSFPNSESFLHFCNPNPSLGRTEIRFHTAQRGKVNISIYDVSGRRVHTLLDEILPPGDHACVWPGEDDRGRPVASGIYWVQMQVKDRSGRPSRGTPIPTSSRRLLTLR